MALYEFWDGLREALELAEKHPDYSAELIHELLVGVDFHRPYQDFEWILRQSGQAFPARCSPFLQNKYGSARP